MKKKKFITPKVRVIKIEAEALLAATGEDKKGLGLQGVKKMNLTDDGTENSFFEE